MLVEFFCNKKLIFKDDIENINKDFYKVGEIIIMPVIPLIIINETETDIKYDIKEYVIFRIKNDFIFTINSIENPKITKSLAALNIELEELKVYKLKQILKLC